MSMATLPSPVGAPGSSGKEQGRSAAPLHASAQRQKRRPMQYDVRIELCGCQNDPTYQACFHLLREYRARYAPLLRMYFTGVSAPLGEQTAADRQQMLQQHFLCRDVAAITVDGHVARQSLCSEGDGGIAAPVPKTTDGPAWVTEFMEHWFLSAKLRRSAQQARDQPHQGAFAFVTQNTLTRSVPPCPDDCGAWPLYVRHYVHEGSRTASFLIGNTTTGHAVVIDPSPNVEQYQRDLDSHGLRLDAIGLTHFYMDVVTGHKQLQACHPHAFVAWCGSMVAKASGGAAPQQRPCVGSVLWCMSLGGAFQLVARWTPAMTNESVTFELMFEETLLAIMGGPSIPVDGWARHDVRQILPLAVDHLLSPAAGGAASTTTTSNGAPELETGLLLATMQWVSQRYFSGGPPPTTPSPTGNSIGGASSSLDAAVVFPSHGGYNHMTHQLDLHWCAHIADLKRFTHVKKLYQRAWAMRQQDGVADDAFLAYLDALPVLPIGPLFRNNRARNMVDAGVACCATALPLRDLSTPLLLASHREVVVVDVRPYASYAAMHLPCSINVPMTYPGGAFRAKKAELWLQCCMQPDVAVRVVCALATELGETRQRLEHIGVPPGNLVVQHSDEVDWTSGIQGAAAPEAAVAKGMPPAGGASNREQSQQEDVASKAESVVVVGWKRLSTAQSLEALSVVVDDGRASEVTTLVVDVRTPYEFKNGSHRSSVHCPLADLCALFVDGSIPPADLAEHILSHLHGSARRNGIPICRRARDLARVIVYCAAGYRSHIGVSLIRAAFERRSAEAAARATASDATDGVTTKRRTFPEVTDVAGGALHIMMHRPDLWIVKDRSIVCIS